ncbi:hypothetical protein U1Q18_019149 [Sarracenia purpurea var. burkii]
MATTDSFSDKNAVFRKLRAKSDNKLFIAVSVFTSASLGDFGVQFFLSNID